MRVEENQTKTRVREDSSLCPESSTKNAVQESFSLSGKYNIVSDEESLGLPGTCRQMKEMGCSSSWWEGSRVWLWRFGRGGAYPSQRCTGPTGFYNSGSANLIIWVRSGRETSSVYEPCWPGEAFSSHRYTTETPSLVYLFWMYCKYLLRVRVRILKDN
jgi:hypothetical protein